MMTQENKGRRDFLKYGAAGVAGLAIGAAATYGMVPPREVTTEVTKTIAGAEVTKTVAGDAASAPGWYPPPARAGAKVPAAITTFDELTEDAYGQAIDRQLELLGGRSKFENLVKGKKVAMKTICHNPTPLEDPLGEIPYPVDDLEQWKPPWPTKGASPSAVHPLMSRALAKRIHQAGATEVSFCEGVDAGGSLAFDYEVCGHKHHLSDLDYVKIVEIDHEKCRMVDVPNPLCKPEYAMPEVLDDHVVLNVAQPKTHYGGNYCQMTSNIKNWIGIQPASWCGGLSGGRPPYTLESRAKYDSMSYAEKFWGDRKNPAYPNQPMDANIFQKGRSHAWSNNKWNDLNTVSSDRGGISAGSTVNAEIADLESIVRTDLALADSAGGTEGWGCHFTFPWYDRRSWGPGSRRMPHRVDMKARVGHHMLIGSYDVVASETVAAQMMGWHPINEIVFSAVAGIGGLMNNLYYASKKGLGECDPRCIDVKGVDSIPVVNFMRPPLGNFRPYPLPFNAWGEEAAPKLNPEFAR
jgi:hypothetical protein